MEEHTIEPQPRAVLWDLDGVIADTKALHLESWRVTLAELGVGLDEEAFRQAFGMRNSEGIPRMLGRSASPEELQRIGERKEALFREMLRGRLRPVPGVREWVVRLRERGWRQAVASSAPRPNITAMLEELELNQAFDATICGEELDTGKPDPEIFLRAAQAVGVPPERCIVVEDAVIGIEAAHRAGMKCIAVATTHSAADLAMADLVVDTPAALPDDAFGMLLAGA